MANKNQLETNVNVFCIVIQFGEIFIDAPEEAMKNEGNTAKKTHFFYINNPKWSSFDHKN